MAHSVEARLPFLTAPLADFVLSLPEDYLVKPGSPGKAILRAAMRGLTPDVVLDRKEKVGFSVPIHAWIPRLPLLGELMAEAAKLPAVDPRGLGQLMPGTSGRAVEPGRDPEPPGAGPDEIQLLDLASGRPGGVGEAVWGGGTGLGGKREEGRGKREEGGGTRVGTSRQSRKAPMRWDGMAPRGGWWGLARAAPLVPSLVPDCLPALRFPFPALLPIPFNEHEELGQVQPEDVHRENDDDVKQSRHGHEDNSRSLPEDDGYETQFEQNGPPRNYLAQCGILTDPAAKGSEDRKLIILGKDQHPLADHITGQPRLPNANQFGISCKEVRLHDQDLEENKRPAVFPQFLRAPAAPATQGQRVTARAQPEDEQAHDRHCEPPGIGRGRPQDRLEGRQVIQEKPGQET